MVLAVMKSTILIRSKVECEPDLESEVNGMRPAARRVLAKKLARWAHQLEVTALVIEVREFQEGMQVPKLKCVPIEKATKN